MHLGPRVALVVVVVAVTPSCAEIAAECAGAVMQATAQVCVDMVCGEDTDVDGTPQPRPVARDESEIPAPAWTPRDANCDESTDDNGVVTVACPDGTRATFTQSRERVVVERAPAEGNDAPCTSAWVIKEGIDVDGDGALSPTEVTGRIFACPDKEGVRAPTLVGHLAILGPDDVVRLAGRRAITGGLVVRSASLVRLELPQLQSLGGTMRVDGASSLESVAFTHLAAVGGDVVVARDRALRTIDLRALRRVGGSVVVVDNPALPESAAEQIVFRLSEHGFAGPVEVAGNRP